MSWKPIVEEVTLHGWKASDGKFFDIKRAAEIHEDHLLIQRDIREILLDYPSIAFDDDEDLNCFLERVSTRILISYTPNYKLEKES